MTAQRVTGMLAVNVVGAVVSCREAVRRLSTVHGGPGGSIVLVSSAAARLGSAGEYVDYAASKAAVDTLGLGLAKEVADEGVRVNVVRPGIIDTGLHASGGQPDRVARIGPAVPVGRAGTADEVAAAVVWLLGEEASYCTGSVLLHRQRPRGGRRSLEPGVPSHERRVAVPARSGREQNRRRGHGGGAGHDRQQGRDARAVAQLRRPR